MKKYKRAVIFAGGGNRTAVYGGMYSALVDNKLAPDLILGTCGGSLSTAIISHFVEPKTIKEYFKSEEFYNFIRSISLTEEKKFFNLPLYIISKVLFSKEKLHVEDTINKYLIKFTEEFETLFPNLINKKSSIDSIIIGSKLRFNEEDVAKKIGNKKICQEVIFTNINDKLNINRIERSEAYKNSIVDDKIEVVNDISLLKASRISMADMFLISPVKCNKHFFAGGAVDLLPIEIADMLADEVILELKQRYTFIENSAVKKVLGYSGNKRFEDVIKMNASHWVDTSDMPRYFRKFYNFLSFNILKMELGLKIPSYKDYCADVDMQWEYGYNRMLESLKLEKNYKLHQRKKIW